MYLQKGEGALQKVVLIVYCHQTFVWKYRISPNRSACPNRCTPLCGKKHITSNSHQVLDKTSKDHPKTVKNIKI